MELETVNKLYLELSQFTTAKTARELKLEQLLLSEDKCCIKADKLGVRMCPDCEEVSSAYSEAMGVGIEPDTLAGKIINIPIPERGFHEGWRDEEIWHWALREAAKLVTAALKETP